LFLATKDRSENGIRERKRKKFQSAQSDWSFVSEPSHQGDFIDREAGGIADTVGSANANGIWGISKKERKEKYRRKRISKRKKENREEK
jgi:hypothetical protein